MLATLLAYSIGGSGGMFQANLVGSSPAPFDGTIYPMQDTLNWVKLSSSEYSSFKSGAFTYDVAKQAGKVMPIPKYDTATLQNDPASLGWQGADLEKRNVLLTYVTAYMGAYTSGIEPAIEQNGSHVGIDIRAAKGTPVYAIANGTVVKSKEDASSGKVVVIEHKDVPSLEDPAKLTTYYSSYLHLDSILASEGQAVKKGDQIGTVGMTGTATTYHLHFQLDKKEAPFHPYWPFTFSEASKAGMDFFTGVNEGLGKEKGIMNTVHAMQWIHANQNGAATTVSPVADPAPEVPAEPTTPVVETPAPTPTPVEPTTPTPQNTNTTPAQPTTPASAFGNAIRFVLFYPIQLNAGETVDVTIRGMDTDGKISGKGLTEPVTLTVEGGAGTVTPASLTPAQLASGEAKVLFTPSSAGSMAIVARSGIVTGTGPVLTAVGSVTQTSTSAPSSIVFADVTANTPHAKAISYLQSQNVVGGYPDGTFKPEQSINRAEVTKVILGGSSIDPLPTVSRVAFSDIFTDDWFAGWVERARELGIVDGNPDGTFTPSTTVNKASALKILLLTNQIDLSSVIVITDPYADVDAGDWFAIYFQYAKEKNLIEADASGKVYPAAGMSRAEVAEMMYRLIRIKETGAERYSTALDL